MSKKMKLNLDELKVQSFVTSLEKEKQMKINGGDETFTKNAECKKQETKW